MAALACFCWSTAFVGIKVGLQYLPPLRFAGLRFALSGLILMPFWLARNHPPFRNIKWGLLILLAFFQTFLLYGLLYSGMTRIPGSLTAILVGSSPLFAALTAHFLMPNDRLTLVKVVALLLGVVGVVFVTLSRRPWGQVGWSEMPGIIMVLGACASSAIGNVIVTKVRKEFPPVFLNSCQIFLGGLGLIAVSFLFEENRSIPVAPGFYLSLAACRT